MEAAAGNTVLLAVSCPPPIGRRAALLAVIDGGKVKAELRDVGDTGMGTFFWMASAITSRAASARTKPRTCSAAMPALPNVRCCG